MLVFPEPWMKLVSVIIVAFLISIATTPIVKAFATKVGAMDVPRDARRVHDHPIPRMGGLAIFLGFLLSVLLFVDITKEVRGILLGLILIVATGVLDDLISLNPWVKLSAQRVITATKPENGIMEQRALLAALMMAKTSSSVACGTIGTFLSVTSVLTVSMTT